MLEKQKKEIGNKIDNKINYQDEEDEEDEEEYEKSYYKSVNPYLLKQKAVFLMKNIYPLYSYRYFKT